MSEFLSRVEQPTDFTRLAKQLKSARLLSVAHMTVPTEEVEALLSLAASLREAEQEKQQLRDTWRANVADLAAQYGEVVAAAEARLRVAEEARDQARRAVTAYYKDHSEDGDPPCPCEACDLARAVFSAALGSVGVGEEG